MQYFIDPEQSSTNAVAAAPGGVVDVVCSSSTLSVTSYWFEIILSSSSFAGSAVLLTDFTPVIPVLLFVPIPFGVSVHLPSLSIVPYFTLPLGAVSSASTFSGNSDSVITRTRTQVRRRLPTFFSDIKKSSFFCLYGAKKGGGDLHLATGCRAARAPFRSVALRHRLSPAVPFSVQLLFCEPHRYLCLPIFYVHSIPDLPKNARRFSKNI